MAIKKGDAVILTAPLQATRDGEPYGDPIPAGASAEVTHIWEDGHINIITAFSLWPYAWQHTVPLDAVKEQRAGREG